MRISPSLEIRQCKMFFDILLLYYFVRCDQYIVRIYRFLSLPFGRIVRFSYKDVYLYVCYCFRLCGFKTSATSSRP